MTRNRSVAGYLKQHWRGEHSLSRSLLINCLPVFALLWLARQIAYLFILEYHQWVFWINMVILPLVLLVVYPWQLVGVVRSSEKYLLRYGNPLVGRSSQAIILVAGVSILLSGVGVFQQIGAYREKLAFEEKWIAATTRSYDIKVVPGTDRIHLKGPMQLGTTRFLEELLKKQSDIKSLVLDSRGGRVYEGRGVARLVREYGLDTYSYAGCYSACTLAFISGKRRYLKEGAKLGFHQYSYSSDKNLGYLDSQIEQEKDMAIFRDQNISERFLTKIFERGKDDMWFPNPETLIIEKVVDEILVE